MAVPKWLKGKTPQTKGREYEKKLAKKLGVKPQPGSGAFPFYKEDIETDTFLIQVKRTGKKQFTLKSADLKTLTRNAAKIGKIPVMIVNLEGQDWSIYKGSPDTKEDGK